MLVLLLNEIVFDAGYAGTTGRLETARGGPRSRRWEDAARAARIAPDDCAAARVVAEARAGSMISESSNLL